MWRVIYYTRPNGRQPAKEWVEGQDNSIKPSIDARIQRLRDEGLLLVENGMLVPIREKRGKKKFIPGFYELKDRTKKWRIAVYHDLKQNSFVLIHGWRKLKEAEEQEIERARTLLNEYFPIEGG